MVAGMMQLVLGEDLPAVMDSRKALRSTSGIEASSAKDLLIAIESHSREEVQKKMEELVKKNQTRLVIITLHDKSEEVMQDAARALAASKKKSTALALLQAEKYLDLAFMGGTEDEKMREKTKKLFEESLSAITGVSVKLEWSKIEKNSAFRHAAEKLKD